MKITRLIGLALVPLSLAACEEEAERTGEMADSILAEAERPDAGQSMSMDTVSTAEGGMQAAFALNAVGGSGVTGEATVAPATDAGQTTATVTLNSGGADGDVHQGHIHQGTCAQIGSVVVPLEPVTISGGTGTSTATVDVDAMTVMDGQHVVGYHQAGGSPGAPAVCGEIPGHVM